MVAVFTTKESPRFRTLFVVLVVAHVLGGFYVGSHTWGGPLQGWDWFPVLSIPTTYRQFCRPILDGFRQSQVALLSIWLATSRSKWVAKILVLVIGLWWLTITQERQMALRQVLDPTAYPNYPGVFVGLEVLAIPDAVEVCKLGLAISAIAWPLFFLVRNDGRITVKQLLLLTGLIAGALALERMIDSGRLRHREGTSDWFITMGATARSISLSNWKVVTGLFTGLVPLSIGFSLFRQRRGYSDLFLFLAVLATVSVSGVVEAVLNSRPFPSNSWWNGTKLRVLTAMCQALFLLFSILPLLQRRNRAIRDRQHTTKRDVK